MNGKKKQGELMYPGMKSLIQKELAAKR